MRTHSSPLMEMYRSEQQSFQLSAKSVKSNYILCNATIKWLFSKRKQKATNKLQHYLLHTLSGQQTDEQREFPNATDEQTYYQPEGSTKWQPSSILQSTQEKESVFMNVLIYFHYLNDTQQSIRKYSSLILIVNHPVQTDCLISDCFILFPDAHLECQSTKNP